MLLLRWTGWLWKKCPHVDLCLGPFSHWAVLGDAQTQPGAVSLGSPGSFGRHQLSRSSSARDNHAATSPQQSSPAHAHLLSGILQSSLRGSEAGTSRPGSASCHPTAEPHVHASKREERRLAGRGDGVHLTAQRGPAEGSSSLRSPFPHRLSPCRTASCCDPSGNGGTRVSPWVCAPVLSAARGPGPVSGGACSRLHSHG